VIKIENMEVNILMEILQRGIDVSTWQGDINWQQVKDSGIDFAILRSSFGSANPKQIDNKFYQNVQGCQAVGMPIGAYHYGYAVSVEQAKGEAQFFLDTIKGIKFDCLVYYDVEDNKTMGTLSKQALTDVVNAFCKVVADAGYRVGVYSSTSWLEDKMDMSQISYPVWCAQYFKECQYTGTYGIWQYTSDGRVNGINARCDMNYAYVDYVASSPVSSTVVVAPTPSPVVQPVAVQQIVSNQQVDVTYQVRANGKWYSQIVNSNNSNSMGYAGSTGKPITDIAIKVSNGSVKYRVHLTSGRWLNYITDFNLNNGMTGYAGNGTPIDALEVYYYTPNSIRPIKKAKYRVSPLNRDYYSYQYDNETDNGQDGYAGCFGRQIDRIQIDIV
jgi:GH25 family lysozyme M1 (1,4-beta-N-acetylmuramidase)